jgi:hypothetical protein
MSLVKTGRSALEDNVLSYKHKNFMMGDFYESSHLEDTELDGRIMSKWSVEKLERGRGLDIY